MAVATSECATVVGSVAMSEADTAAMPVGQPMMGNMAMP
jgi:hypothetical protein